MRPTRREFLKQAGTGVLITSGLLAGGVRAQDTCTRVNGAGSYRLGPFDPVEDGADPVYLITDLGFDETMLFCKVGTNYEPFLFPTAKMGVVEIGAHEFYMDMRSVWIRGLEIVETADWPQALFEGQLRSVTRLFSGDQTQTYVEQLVDFGCAVTEFGPEANIEVTRTNFSMTAHFDPEKEHAAIFGAEATFAGHVDQGNIMVIA